MTDDSDPDQAVDMFDFDNVTLRPQHVRAVHGRFSLVMVRKAYKW